MKRGDRVTRGTPTRGDLLPLDLVVDASERDRELVVGVADVGEVRVYASHDLGRQVDVYVALGAGVLIVHAAITATAEREPMTEPSISHEQPADGPSGPVGSCSQEGLRAILLDAVQALGGASPASADKPGTARLRGGGTLA